MSSHTSFLKRAAADNRTSPSSAPPFSAHSSLSSVASQHSKAGTWNHKRTACSRRAIEPAGWAGRFHRGEPRRSGAHGRSSMALAIAASSTDPHESGESGTCNMRALRDRVGIHCGRVPRGRIFVARAATRHPVLSLGVAASVARGMGSAPFGGQCPRKSASRGGPSATHPCPAVLPPTSRAPAKACALATDPNSVQGGANSPHYDPPRRCTAAFATTTNRASGEERRPPTPAYGPHIAVPHMHRTA